MAQKFTIFLPDGTPLRADVSVKTGLPAGLLPAALAARQSHYTVTGGVVTFGDGVTGARPPTGARGHAGGVNAMMMDGSVRMFQPNQSDLAFLSQSAGRVPLEQITHSGPGALFLDCQGTPAPEIANFLRRLELAAGAGRAIERLKIGANPPPTAPAAAPGAHTVPSQMRVLTLSPGPAGPHLQARGAPAPAAAAAVGIDRFTQGFEKTFTILSVFPAQFSGGATSAQSNSIAMEKITLTYDHIRVP
jgi:prepilin-type processing-associated H-X9-DG protein